MVESDFEIKELCEVGVVLYDCEHATPPDEGSGYPYIAIPNIKDGHIVLDTVRRINRDQLEKWNRRVTPRAGDIILTRRGRVGDSAVVPVGMLCAIGQNLVILRAESAELDQGYLRWSLRGPHFESELGRLLNVGAVFNSLNCSDIPKFRITVPPLAEQHAIADVLGALEDKIESNRRMADLLIRLARTMMSVGQYEVRLGDIAKCEKGLSYKGDGLEENLTLGIPMINLANFGVNGWLNAEKMKFYSGEYKERHLLKVGDLVVANTDLTQQRVIIGRPALVPPELGKAIFTHHVTAIRPLEDEELTFPIWAQLNSPGFRERAEGFATGTTVAGMPVEALLDFNVSIPDEGVIRDARELLQRVWAAETESRSLIRTRDTLLPELLSGRLRVKDAESMMENM